VGPTYIFITVADVGRDPGQLSQYNDYATGWTTGSGVLPVSYSIGTEDTLPGGHAARTSTVRLHGVVLS